MILFKRTNRPNYFCEWTDTTGGNKVTKSTGCSVKREALKVAKDLVSNHENGTVQTMRTALSMKQVMKLYHEEQACNGRKHKYIVNAETVLRKLGIETGWDMQVANKVLGSMVDQGRSDATIKSYFYKLKSYGNWVKENGYRNTDPTVGLRKPQRVTGKVYKRGAFTQDEAMNLCASEAISEDHRFVYLTAITTGLRRNELRQLSMNNLCIHQGQYCIHLAPSQVKNRYEDFIPIPESLFVQLKAGRLNLKDFRNNCAETLREDILKVGIQLKDVNGHVRDFHSLRNTLATTMIEQGHSIHAVSKRLRHRDGGKLLMSTYLSTKDAPAFDIFQKPTTMQIARDDKS